MNKSRRNFLKIAGITAVGIASDNINSRTQKTVSRINKAVVSTKKITKSKVAKKERLAMVVDLRKCITEKGCTKCIDVCNKIHNIPDMTEKLKDKKVPVFCNNCDDPPCVEVCPTQATFQRDDGIVMMDWHRCIGCRYCMAACPYGSRSFNWRDPKPFIKEINPDFPTRTKGVVEKCTFCDERLAQGLPPACVEVCPEKALTFGNLNDPESEVRKLLKDNFSIRRKPGLGTNPEIYYLV